jgi:2-dehydro-3-deoxyphosphogluconate aldolase/(4S)-4-hydroxy-2-oxoglutarate aldolase
VNRPADLRTGPVAAAIRAHRLVVILRRIEPRDRLLALADELVAAGARIFEVTFDAPSAGEDLAALREHLEERGRRAGQAEGSVPILVGAGTLVRPDQLGSAVRAGADFGVAPILDHRMVALAIDAGLPFVPAGLTPTEIASAWAAGATFVKLFPASTVGPAMVRELRGPLGEIELIPTGGVQGTNAAQFLEAGAAAVGIGGAIVRAAPDQRRAIIGSVTGGQQ